MKPAHILTFGLSIRLSVAQVYSGFKPSAFGLAGQNETFDYIVCLHEPWETKKSVTDAV